MHLALSPQAAVLVVASHRKSGLSEFLLGSVAATCTRDCTRPVLVLHAPSQDAPQPGSGLLDRLASAAATALGGHPEEAAAAAAAASAAAAAQPKAGSCSVGRNVVLAVDDSGKPSCDACDSRAAGLVHLAAFACRRTGVRIWPRSLCVLGTSAALLPCAPAVAPSSAPSALLRPALLLPLPASAVAVPVRLHSVSSATSAPSSRRRVGEGVQLGAGALSPPRGHLPPAEDHPHAALPVRCLPAGAWSLPPATWQAVPCSRMPLPSSHAACVQGYVRRPRGGRNGLLHAAR